MKRRQQKAATQLIYTYLFTKMVALNEKNTYIQKYTINRNGSRNEEKSGINNMHNRLLQCRPVYSNGNIQKPVPC